MTEQKFYAPFWGKVYLQLKKLKTLLIWKKIITPRSIEQFECWDLSDESLGIEEDKDVLWFLAIC